MTTTRLALVDEMRNLLMTIVSTLIVVCRPIVELKVETTGGDICACERLDAGETTTTNERAIFEKRRVPMRREPTLIGVVVEHRCVKTAAHAFRSQDRADITLTPRSSAATIVVIIVCCSNIDARSNHTTMLDDVGIVVVVARLL